MEQCTICTSLEELQKKLDCTIALYSKKKYSALIYNLAPCCDIKLRDLLRYKRILLKRLKEPTYPCPSINIQDILTEITLLVDNTPCNKCPDCKIDVLPSTTTTTTLSGCYEYHLIGSILGPATFHYYSCEGIPVQEDIDDTGAYRCINTAYPILILAGAGSYSLEGACTATTTTTSTTTTKFVNNCSRYRITYNSNNTFPFHYAFSYVKCGEAQRTIDYLITDDPQNFKLDLCCVPNSIVVDPIFTVTLLNPICIP